MQEEWTNISFEFHNFFLGKLVFRRPTHETVVVVIDTLCRWSGPISVALFLPDVEFSIGLVFIEFLRNCYPAVRDQVNIRWRGGGVPH